MPEATTGHPITRRQALGGAVAGLASAALPLGAGFWAAPAEASTTTTNAGSMGGLVGSSFRVHLSYLRWRTVVLESVSRSSPGGGTDPSFLALVFAGPADNSFAEGTYVVSHQTLNLPAMFISPIGRPDGMQRYQIIISQ